MRSTLTRFGAAISRLGLFSPSIKEQVLRLLRHPDYVPAPMPELLRQLRIPAARAPELSRLLRELERAGEVARIKGDRYVLPFEADLIPGRLSVNRQGKGFLAPDDASLPEIVIPNGSTGTALNLDHVLVRRDAQLEARRPRAPQANTGMVIRILERRHTRLVGTRTRNGPAHAPHHQAGRPARGAGGADRLAQETRGLLPRPAGAPATPDRKGDGPDQTVRRDDHQPATQESSSAPGKRRRRRRRGPRTGGGE